MKLWVKISLLMGVILFLAMGIFGGGIIYQTLEYNRNQMVESSQEQMKVNAAVLAKEIGDRSMEQFGDTTQRSYLTYLVQKYGGRDYMLLKDGEVVANQTSYRLLPGQEGRWQTTEIEYEIQKTGGRYILVMGQRLGTGSRDHYKLVLVKEITSLYEELFKQVGIFLILYLVVIFFAVDITFWLVRMVLKPMRELEETAMAISEGDLSRRIRIRRNDEVGKVSVAFNQMADRVEYQMAQLEDVSERRLQLLGSLTHELKTPMTSIIGYSDTLLHVKISKEQEKKALEHINSECRRLERLSGKLMFLIGLYDENRVLKEVYPVEKLLKGVEAMERYHMAQAGITLEISCKADTLLMDVDLMESLLINLLDNAIKASGKGDRILLLAEKNRICVKDYGKGIPKSEISKVTEAFYMVDKSRSRKNGSLGMGLALCQKIAALHDAYLEITSELGKGTEITVVFPPQQEGAKEESL